MTTHSNEQYWRLFFTTQSRGRISRQRIVGSYQRSLEEAVAFVKGQYPNVKFGRAKRFLHEKSASAVESYALTPEGEIQDPVDPDVVLTPPTPESMRYWRVVLNTGGTEGKRILFEGYYQTLEIAIWTAARAYPNAVFFAATWADSREALHATRRFELKMNGTPIREFIIQPGETDPLKHEETTMTPKPTIDSKQLYITSLDEEAERRPGEDDHVRLQRATLTMLRALYRQNEEITAAVTKHADIDVHLHGVDELDDEEPQDFDAYRCAAFEATVSRGQRVGSNRRCVLLDYHDGFPSKGHFYDPQTPCICGKAIWSPACRQEEHPNGVAPESDPRCAYRNENLARCVKSRHQDSKHTYIR